jgi:c-di-GMP phosphodiesterase
MGHVMPHVSKLRHLLADNGPAANYVDLLDANLRQITASLSSGLAAAFAAMTPAEAEIAQMIIHGRSTKEIAATLSRGASTVDFHRNNIRRKLGLTHASRNLRQHLRHLQ